MESNLDMDEEYLKEDTEEMGIDDEDSDGDSSVDSAKEREEHHALERKIVDLRKEVWPLLIYLSWR